MPEIERITKLQAAGRQLATATRLYFCNDDTVAIHTLVAASYNIIRDISKHQGMQGMAVKDYFLTTVPQLKQQEVLSWVNSFENFFKHADRDPNGEIEFNFEVTELMLIDAWGQYERICGALPKMGKLFKVWTGKSNTNVPEAVKLFVSQFRGLSKWQFYEKCSPLLT